MNNIKQIKAYKNAKKRISEERSFYAHCIVYIIMNVIIFSFKLKLGSYLNSEDYNEYLFWNILSTPFFWGIGLLGHGLWIFRETNGLQKLLARSVYSTEWEKRKIQEFMNEKEKN